MKNLKKLFVLCLAFVMVMSLSTNALAATVVNETSHNFMAYQIFSGTQAADDASLGNANWGSGIDPVGLVAALKAKNPTLYASVSALTATSTDAEKKAAAAAVVSALLADGGGADYHADADEFANVAVNHITGIGTPIASSDTSVTLASGYYLIVDTTTGALESDAKNPALLQVTNKGHIQIAKKYNVPVVDKHIVHGTETVDVDSHSIGDTVHFRLDATMANNLEDYEMYRLVFHDAMSEGLTFNASSVKVYVDGTEITSGFEVVTAGMSCSYGIDCTFEVVFEDVLQVSAIQNNSKVHVEYTATVNENAVVNGPNPNTVLLEFSNDPDWEVPPPADEPDPIPPTGYTPPHSVKVYTTEVSLSKVDNHEDPLTGAEFTLVGTSANVVKITADRFVEDAAGTYWELTDGTYTTTDPATPGVDTSTYKDVSKTYKLTTVEEFKYTKSSEVAKAFVGYDGKLKFTGLGPGVYTVTESVVPGGYNPIDEMTLTITFDEDAEKFSYDWAWPGGHSFSSSAQIEVINQKGSVLPETGGAGTTMIYVSGSILVAAAAVLLVLKKRKAEEN